MVAKRARLELWPSHPCRVCGSRRTWVLLAGGGLAGVRLGCPRNRSVAEVLNQALDLIRREVVQP